MQPLAPWRHFAHQYRVLQLRRRKWSEIDLDPAVESSLSEPSPAPRTFVLLVADFGNLGDVAIGQSHIELLRRLHPRRETIPVSYNQTLAFIRAAKGKLRRDDVITVVGGGALGDLYHDVEHLHRTIARAFREQPVLLFPCSTHFDDTPFGRWWLRLSRRAYERHADLTIMLRDRASFERASAYFPRGRLLMAPDVALTLNAPAGPSQRHGVVVALRGDVEASLAPAVREQITEGLAVVGEVHIADTDVNRADLPRDQGLALLDDLLRTFGGAEVVVTDRLHGTIFALLMGTPCVVFDNSYGKIHEFLTTWNLDGEGVRVVHPSDAPEVPELVSDLMTDVVSAAFGVPEVAQVLNDTLVGYFAERDGKRERAEAHGELHSS